uniref:Putative secreted protein n=1 Tax=Ixodes ricinus TaxID=34613 RepID=A0A6B0U1U6_IXORI
MGLNLVLFLALPSPPSLCAGATGAAASACFTVGFPAGLGGGRTTLLPRGTMIPSGAKKVMGKNYAHLPSREPWCDATHLGGSIGVSVGLIL